MAGEEEWMDDDHVVLTDEDGKEHSFEVVDVIEVEGSEYAILTPEEEGEESGDEAVIFRIDHDDDGDEVLVEIEDNEEWERVAAAYDRMVEEEDESEEEDGEAADGESEETDDDA